ncbi:MAG TPA: DNA helicase, partial [Cycloclasticus sp.]|nr:DNA helicase [Cycloclasticus sp.]
SLTRAYLHPADRIAWLSVLRAPWCAVSLDDMYRLLDGFPDGNVSDLLHDSDSVQTLSEQGQAAIGHVMQAFGVALRHRDRMSVADSIRGLWQQLLGPECLSSSADLADCERFFDCLEALESERESIDLAILQEQVQKLYAAPDVSAPNTLQIMTIHKAKGLEFDHVILPGLDRKAGNDDKRLLAWLERPSDMPSESELMIAPIKETGAEEDDAIAKYLNRVEQDKARHESQRLLYVAATRAKKQLHLSFCLKIDEKTEEPKAPANNTLLGLLWPTIKDDVIVSFISNKLDDKDYVTSCYIKRLNINDVEKLDYSNLDYQHQVTTNIQPQTNLIEFDWAT